MQRIGGRNAILVAGDPARAEAAPVFSPDGASIAFHERGGRGGIFIAGATGESTRRVTDFGFHPGVVAGRAAARVLHRGDHVACRAIVNQRLVGRRGEGRRPAQALRRRRGAAHVVPVGREDRVLGSRYRSARHLYDPGLRRSANRCHPRRGARLGAEVVRRRALPLLLERPRRLDEHLAHRDRRSDRRHERPTRTDHPRRDQRRSADAVERRHAHRLSIGRRQRPIRSRSRSIRQPSEPARRSRSSIAPAT